MSNETLFFIVGGALTVLALITSFVGLRWEKFPPSKGAMAAGIAVFVLLVGGSMAFGWMNGEDEQEHRNQEIAEGHLKSPQQALEELVAAGDKAQNEETGGGEEAGAEEGGGEEAAGQQAASVDGAQVFSDQGCGSCHTLADAGAAGTAGPNLDDTLADKDAAYIKESIVDPNAQIADGFGPDIMPQDYGNLLSAEELDALIEYLSQATSG